jgi:hypothetical protein
MTSWTLRPRVNLMRERELRSAHVRQGVYLIKLLRVLRALEKVALSRNLLAVMKHRTDCRFLRDLVASQGEIFHGG